METVQVAGPHGRSNSIGQRYTSGGAFWDRSTSKIQSDYICRPQAIRALGPVGGKIIGDLGSGEGCVARRLAERGARVIALDISQGLVERSAQAALDEGLNVYSLQGDVRNLDIDTESLDAALSINVAPHLDSAGLRRAFSETYRVLKPGGTFLFAAPNPEIYRLTPATPWIAFRYRSSEANPDGLLPITLKRADGAGFDAEVYAHLNSNFETMLMETGFEVEKVLAPLANARIKGSCPHMWQGAEDNLPFYLIYLACKVSPFTGMR